MRDLLLVLMLSTTACSSDVFKGTDGGSVLPGASSDGGKTDAAPDAPASCDSRLNDNACARCMGTSCCAITKQCLDDPDCYEACIDPGGSCTSNDIGTEVSSCGSAQCAVECQ